MEHDSRAQPSGVDIGAPAEDYWAPIGVHVLVVCLEKTDREVMVEQRGLIIHPAARRQTRPPFVVLMVGPIHRCPSHQCVHEWSDVSIRESHNQAATYGLEAVIVSLGTDVREVLWASPLVFGIFCLDTDEAIEVIGSAKYPAHVHGIVREGRNGAIPLRNLDSSLGSEVAVAEKDVRPRRVIVAARPSRCWCRLAEHRNRQHDSC
jgi:hypothetical protein